MAETQKQQLKDNDVIIPFNIRPGKFVQAAADNNDNSCSLQR